MKVTFEYNVFASNDPSTLPMDGIEVEVMVKKSTFGDTFYYSHIGKVRHASDEVDKDGNCIAPIYADVDGYELKDGDMWIAADNYWNAINNPTR